MGERQYLAVALWVLAVVAVLFFLRAARDLLVPIALAFLCSHALEPAVGWLERHRVPRLFGAPAIVLLVVALAAAASYSVLDDAVQVIESLPGAARQARQIVTTYVGRSAGAVRQVTEILAEIGASGVIASATAQSSANGE